MPRPIILLFCSSGHSLSIDGPGFRLLSLHNNAMELYTWNCQLLSFSSELTVVNVLIVAAPRDIL